MRFVYDGFQQEGDRRCFLFRVDEKDAAISLFSIRIDLALLLRNRIPMQAAPMFCLNLLTEASQGEPGSLNRLQSYTVVGDDFSKIHTERKRKEAEKLSKKPYRRPFGAPSSRSNLYLGSPSNSPHAEVRRITPASERQPLPVTVS
jgi:hypothetical protein